MDGLFNRLQEALGHTVDGVELGPGEQHRELVSPEPGDDLSWSHVLLQPLADDAQYAVTHLMPVAVVDGLEAVEVEVEHGHRHRLASKHPETRLQVPPVRQPREVVVVHHLDALPQPVLVVRDAANLDYDLVLSQRN